MLPIIVINNDCSLVSHDDLRDLYSSLGYDSDEETITQLQKAIAGSKYVWLAWDNTKLVGFCAAVGDTQTCMVNYLVVDKDHQLQGIGSELFKSLCYNAVEDKYLVMTNGNHMRFFAKNNFSMRNVTIMKYDRRDSSE